MGTAQGTSASNLNWQHVMYSFVTSATTTPIRILLDGVALGDKELKGRMAMLDNLSVVEVLPARIRVASAQVYALAGIANALPRLIVTSQDTDGSESYRIELKGVPAGVTISDGVHSITNTGNESIPMNLAGMDLSKLTIHTTDCFCGDIKLTVVSYSKEASNQSTAISSYYLTVSVLSGQPVIPQSGYVSVIPVMTNTTSTAPATPVTTAGVTAATTTPTTLSVSGVQVVEVSPTTGASVLFSASMPVLSADDRPVTDEWLASLEKTAREKWVV